MILYPARVVGPSGGWDRCRAEIGDDEIVVTDGRSGRRLGAVVGPVIRDGQAWVCGGFTVSRAKCACGGTVTVPA